MDIVREHFLSRIFGIQTRSIRTGESLKSSTTNALSSQVLNETIVTRSQQSESEREMVLKKASPDIDLMAHLMRRAGFGATRDELERRSNQGYEETIEELLNPGTQTPVDIYEFLRYYPMWWKPGTMGGLGDRKSVV